ncbi:MAG: hypothetical protein HOP95_11280 [Sphingomonas sp.]|nr:hypothetical protein [Sphingomonas sp.]
MATTHGSDVSTGIMRRLFVEHPRSLGMSWSEHGVGAVVIGATLVGAGAACLIHAIVPGWFTQTAGKTVERMHDHMLRRKAGAANPENWPDYEI